MNLTSTSSALQSSEFSPSRETGLPVESYLNDLDERLNEFSSTMSVDTDILQENPEGGNSWVEIEHYLSSIRVSEDQPKAVHLPYWGYIDLPSAKDLADPNPEDFTPEDVLGRLFVVNAALNVNFDYYNKDSSQVESMTLGKLIGDIYPGLEGGIRDIRKELESAFKDPEKFKEKFTKSEGSKKQGLMNKAFLRVGTEAAAATMFVLASMSLSSCASNQLQVDPVPVVETFTPTSTKTEESSPTPTITEESTVTPTETIIPTNTVEPTSTPTRIPTSEEYWVRGYMLDIAFSGEDGWCTTLYVEEANIKNYYVEGDEIVLEVDMLIYERQMENQLRAESFEFVKYDANTRSFSKPQIFTIENFSDLHLLLNGVGSNIRYQVEVIAEDYPEFSDDFVVDYVSGYIDPNFKTVQIVQYEKTW